MKRRLFWKILLAFWLTFLAITQGVWLLFEFNRARREPPERPMAQAVAPAVLAAGAELVARSGPSGFDDLVKRLPEKQRNRLELIPGRLSTDALKNDVNARMKTVVVLGPGQQRYELRYWYRNRDRSRFPFNTPPELLIVGLLGGLLFSAALAWYMTAPVNRLRLGFDSLARGNLGTRLGATMGRRRDEITDLAHDFDLMAQRLEQLVGARDRLLHDVSHELRSPLARLQLAIALARQSPTRIDFSLERIEREAVRLDTLVGELLALARAEHDAASGEHYFDLAEIVRNVVEDARFEAQASDVTIALAENIPAEERRPALSGNAELVRRAIDNVVRNALRFSKAGQQVSVEIQFLPGEHAYQIEISDNGPGVSHDEIGTIFEPFVRGENTGKGPGLGLAIANRAIIAHGGRIEARNRPEGGLALKIYLPVGLPA
jgi:two-component system OmpR family sensor kinase